MALLMLITLGAFSSAGQMGRYALGQRGTKVQLVQLCQLAHTNTDQKLASGDEFEEIIRKLSDAPRRRHPALPERWACS